MKRTGQKARSLNKFKPNILSLNYSAAGAGVSVAGASPDFVNVSPKIHQQTMAQCVDGVSSA